MATSKLLKPTNVTISIPGFTDQPDQRVNSNCIDKEADAINELSDKIGTLQKKLIHKTLYKTVVTGTSAYLLGGVNVYLGQFSVSSDMPSGAQLVSYIAGGSAGASVQRCFIERSAEKSFFLWGSSGQSYSVTIEIWYFEP